jgi:hypothetical protein
MTIIAFDDQPPQSSSLTDYDRQHHALYIRLLDAADEGAEWTEVVRLWATSWCRGLVSGIPPRARKARYYEDRRLTGRILAPLALTAPGAGGAGGRPVTRASDWTPLLDQEPDAATPDESAAASLVDRDRASVSIPPCRAMRR